MDELWCLKHQKNRNKTSYVHIYSSTHLQQKTKKKQTTKKKGLKTHR